MNDSDNRAATLLELVGKRYEFLAALDASPAEKRRLVEDIGVSRSTVDRAVRELDTADLVVHTGSRYRLTLYGRTLLTIYDSLLDTIEETLRARSLLVSLPPDVEFDFSLLFDAEVHLAATPAIRPPDTPLAELVERASGLRGLAYGRTSAQLLERFRRRVCGDGMAAELVFREATIASLLESTPTALRDIASTDGASVYSVGDVPFGLFVLDGRGPTRVCIVVYGSEQTLEGLIVNDSPEAVAWARAVFEYYRARADPVTFD